VVAHPHAGLVTHSRRLHWRRLVLAAASSFVIALLDISWKAASVASGRSAIDAPTSTLRPLGTLLIGALALAGVLLLPRICLPGVLLVVGGAASNVGSLAVWRAVPDPLGVHLAGGILHFNLADLCVWGGGLLFLAASLWTIWRMPAERFAQLSTR
jgi:hypothetical protein